MPRKSKKYSGKHKNAKNKSTTSAGENITPPHTEVSPPVLPLGTLEESSNHDVPATSCQRPMAHLKRDELLNIKTMVNVELDKCFQNKSEIILNQRMLDDIVSNIVGAVYANVDSSKDNSAEELLIAKCKSLETEKISLTKEISDLEREVENAQLLAKKLVNENHTPQCGKLKEISAELNATVDNIL